LPSLRIVLEFRCDPTKEGLWWEKCKRCPLELDAASLFLLTNGGLFLSIWYREVCNYYCFGTIIIVSIYVVYYMQFWIHLIFGCTFDWNYPTIILFLSVFLPSYNPLHLNGHFHLERDRLIEYNCSLAI
jgi:hypothetical protein